MSAENVLKSLSRETKALIIVSEFEARRMPMFQMREVLHELVSSEEEKKFIVDLVENDLKATGYHPQQITAFLQDLLGEGTAKPDESLRATRRLRSPFAMSFESGQVVQGSGGDVPAPQAPNAAAGATPETPAKPPMLTPATNTIISQTRVLPKTLHEAPHVLPPVAPASHVPALPDAPSLPDLPRPAPGFAAGAPPLGGPAAQGVRVSNVVPSAEIPRPKVPANPPRSSGPPLPAAAPDAATATIVRSKDGTFFGGGMAGGITFQKRPTVLLADDDKRIRIVFKLCLERVGCQVLEAEDGNEAWNKIQESSFDLVVLDMKMPGLHGLEVLTRMAARQLGTPVIICSAYDQLKDEFVVASYPKLRYLIKPVPSETLEAAVRELLQLPAK